MGRRNPGRLYEKEEGEKQGIGGGKRILRCVFCLNFYTK